MVDSISANQNTFYANNNDLPTQNTTWGKFKVRKSRLDEALEVLPHIIKGGVILAATGSVAFAISYTSLVNCYCSLYGYF